MSGNYFVRAEILNQKIEQGIILNEKKTTFIFCLLMGSTDKSANMKCCQPCPLNNLKLKYSDFYH